MNEKIKDLTKKTRLTAEEFDELKGEVVEADISELYIIKKKIYNMRNELELMLQESIQIDNRLNNILK